MVGGKHLFFLCLVEKNKKKDTAQLAYKDISLLATNFSVTQPSSTTRQRLSDWNVVDNKDIYMQAVVCGMLLLFWSYATLSGDPGTTFV